MDRERGPRWWRVAGVALVGSLFLAGPIAGAQAADQLFNESFVNSTVTLPGLTVGHSGGGHPFGQVCLTASTNVSQTPIPGCTSGQAAIPTRGDASGHGALRLTDNERDVAGYVLYNVPLPLTGGLDVHFDLYSYDTTSSAPADGVSFFLVDGKTDLKKPGAAGGSLGYAQKGETDGVANGYLGVGLDEWGNFTNDGEGRGTGCGTKSSYSGLHKNWVGVRGPGNGTNDYCLLGATEIAGDKLADPDARSRAVSGVRQVVDIHVDPPGSENAQVKVSVNGKQIISVPEPSNPPPTFKFGLAASTGGSTDIHEISNLSVMAVNSLPKLSVSMVPTAAGGGRGTYTLTGTVESGNPDESKPVTIIARLAGGLTIAARPSGEGWDCSATVVGSSRVSCTYTPSGPVAAGTQLPPITVPAQVELGVTGALTSKAAINSIDNGNLPERSTATSTVDVGGADVYVRVTAPSSPLSVHQAAAFDVTVGNHGLRTALGVEVSIPVPSGATVRSVPPECHVTDATIVCSVGRLTAGQQVSLRIVLASADAGRLELTAAVTGTMPDSNPANNEAPAHASVSGPPPPPNDRANAKLTPKPPSRTDHVGEPVTFSWVASNPGPANATGVEVVITLPPGAKFVSGSPECKLHGEIVICRIGDLAKGASRTVSVTFKPGSTGRADASATMRADQVDAHPSEEEASEGTSVLPAAPPAPPPPAVSG